MILPMNDPQNPWHRTHGRSSADCGLTPGQRIDRLRKVGQGRYAYDMDTATPFAAKSGPAYVIAWRPHNPSPEAPLSPRAAIALAHTVADQLAAGGIALRGAA